jgi:AraC family transcriptional regulator, transcriptional activator of pobA
MTVDRLNRHVKRSTGVLTEAKRQLVFTTEPIQDKELAFADPSHFARFFRKATGTTPHDFPRSGG